MPHIDFCPQCHSFLFSSMDRNNGKTKEGWDNKRKHKVQIKYKKYNYRCSVCNYKFKEDEVHYD
jgi:uncharacterized protein (DUF2225 family)